MFAGRAGHVDLAAIPPDIYDSGSAAHRLPGGDAGGTTTTADIVHSPVVRPSFAACASRQFLWCYCRFFRCYCCCRMAERVGFEPTSPSRDYPLSRRAPSATRSPLRLNELSRMGYGKRVRHCGPPSPALSAVANQTVKDPGALRAMTRHLPSVLSAAVARRMPFPCLPLTVYSVTCVTAVWR